MVELKFLKVHPLFGGLKDEELKKITPLLKEQHFSKGQNIVNEDDMSDKIYIIYKGSVEILKNVTSLKGTTVKRISIFHVGDSFGEMELIDIQPCAATVRTLEDTHVLTLSNMDLYSISKWNLKTYTLIIMNIAREISRRLRHMNDLFANVISFAPNN